MTKSKEFEEEILSFLETTFKGHGLDSLSCKLISRLYLEPTEISMEDLSEKTGYSLSAVSTKLKLWESMGMIDKIKKPGTKKLYYYMDKDVKALNIKKFKIVLETMSNVRMIIPEIVKRYEKDAMNSNDKRFNNQLIIMDDYAKQLGLFENVLKNTLKELEKM